MWDFLYLREVSTARSSWLSLRHLTSAGRNSSDCLRAARNVVKRSIMTAREYREHTTRVMSTNQATKPMWANISDKERFMETLLRGRTSRRGSCLVQRESDHHREIHLHRPPVQGGRLVLPFLHRIHGRLVE